MPCMHICQGVTYQHNRHERRRKHRARRALSILNRTQNSHLCRLSWTVNRVLTFAFDIFIKHIWKFCTSLPISLNYLYQIITEVFDLRPENSLPRKSGLVWMSNSKHCAFSCVFMAADLKVT